MKILVVKLEHTNLVNRADLLDWLCSPTINRGKQTERYWIMKADTQIFNQYNDPDVSYLMAMLSRAQNSNYSSLMIMKNGTDYRADDSKNSGEQGSAGPEASQQTNSPISGEVPVGEPHSEVPPSTPHPEVN